MTNGAGVSQEVNTSCVDLEFSAAEQRVLLPPSPFVANGWTAAHRFHPAGAVGGDYVDLIPHRHRVYFALGDVSGKGVAASMLMGRIHAMFRALVPFDLPLELLIERASALVCASSLPAQYATLVFGYLEPDGRIVIGNAGHPPPIVIAGGRAANVHPTGGLVGMFCQSEFASTELSLTAGDTLLIYSDGLTEAENSAGEEYGADRVKDAVVRAATLPVEALLDRALFEQARFRGERANTDDVTLLAIRRD